MISRQRILNKLHSSLVALSWLFLFLPSYFYFFKFVFHNEGEERQRAVQILNYSEMLVIFLYFLMWVKMGRGRCIEADSRLF